MGALFSRTVLTLPDPAVGVEGVAMGRKKKTLKGEGALHGHLTRHSALEALLRRINSWLTLTVGNVTTKDKLSRTRHGRRDIVHYVQQTVTDDRVIRHIRLVQVVISAIAILLEIALIHG